MMGKSRSATLVIAYLLSQDNSLTPSSALESLRTVRSIAEPNEGFWRQLELYHSMGCPVDVGGEPAYQRWLYQREVDLSVACGRAPDTIRFEDEAAPGSPDRHDVEIRCRKCRRSLATNQYVVAHAPTPTSPMQMAMVPIGAPDPSAPAPCAHLFLDPLSWMREELEQGRLEGRLLCPNAKCGANVGKYAWQGMRCSCQQWVCPAISLARARVDEIRRATPKREGKM